MEATLPHGTLDFNDSNWLSGSSGVGYETSAMIIGFDQLIYNDAGSE